MQLLKGYQVTLSVGDRALYDNIAYEPAQGFGLGLTA